MLTWILVANQSRALLFSRSGMKPELSLLNTIEHPIGRAHEGDLITGSQGSVIQSAAQGQRRDTETEVSATEHNAQLFAGDLASTLRDGRTRGDYERLVLVAAPEFLGNLRKAMDEPTSNLITLEVPKNLAQQPEESLASAVLDLMADH